MKTRNYLLNLMVGSALVFSAVSCEKNDGPKPEGPKPDGEALLEMFGENVADATQHFTLNAEDGGSITGEEGTIVQFGSNAFLTENGDPVTGDVDIELVEIFSKARMALTEMSTKGRNGDGDIATLISAGEFYINATKDGNQLKPAEGFTLIVPAENTGDPDDQMGLFTGKEECDDNDCDVVWEQEDKGVQLGQRENATGGVSTVYYAFQSQFGWTNIDRWYSDPRPKTTIFVDVPEGYDNTNCAVYLSYDGEPTALAQFDVYNEDTQLFTEHYGLIPIGLEVHFIMISIVDGQYNYAIQAATITDNHVQVIGDLQPITEEALTELINDLP